MTVPGRNSALLRSNDPLEASPALTHATMHREMTKSPDAQGEIGWLYQAISQDFRYGHYVRIPERICRCLEYFNVSASRKAVQERLRSYYLFIGVVDHVIDSRGLEAGREILKQLGNRTPPLNEEARQSPATVVTEVLKYHIGLEIFPTVLAKLEELYEAVVTERKSRTMRAYIEQRTAVGCLTAEVSYLLIRPLLKNETEDLICFFQKVGEVGCLVDSVIDLRADNRLGLLAFRPTLKDCFELITQMLRDGLKIVLKHPRLLGLFVEAIGDDLLDLFRARETPLVLSPCQQLRPAGVSPTDPDGWRADTLRPGTGQAGDHSLLCPPAERPCEGRPRGGLVAPRTGRGSDRRRPVTEEAEVGGILGVAGELRDGLAPEILRNAAESHVTHTLTP